MFVPSLKLRKYFINLQQHLEKRRHGNNKEVRDNKQAYRLSDPAPCLFLFRVRTSIQGTVIKICILRVFTGTDGKGKFFFIGKHIKNRFMKQPAGIDISKNGFHVCLKEQLYEDLTYFLGIAN
ncbi:hypothetical protein Barb6XT_01709 [Bacteroidales bacterium Barb6XT]|nr:hypothetical protein Barb6XT_01709 [Bacteroidales bacterium Barb6XT]